MRALFKIFKSAAADDVVGPLLIQLHTSLMRGLFALALLCAASSAVAFSCLDESGQPISWFAQLKYPNGGTRVSCTRRSRYLKIQI